MGGFFQIKGNCLIWKYDGERVRIEPWGPNSLRFRCIRAPFISISRDWALIKQHDCKAKIRIENDIAMINNGKITCTINLNGAVEYFNDKGKVLLRERWRDRNNSSSF